MDTAIKRIFAYLLDVLIISLVANIITSIKVINPYYESYQEEITTLTELEEQYSKEEISKEEYIEKYIPLNYDLSKHSVVQASVTVGLLVLYFGLYQCLANGQTLGKKVLKIRIESVKDKKLNIGNYLLRCVILNNVIFRILIIIGPFMMKANPFNTYSYVVSIIEGTIECIIFALVMLRQDGRGLHDFIAGTKVVNLNAPIAEESPVEEKKEEVKVIEAEEKPKTKKKTKKENTKK